MWEYIADWLFSVFLVTKRYYFFFFLTKIQIKQLICQKLLLRGESNRQFDRSMFMPGNKVLSKEW